MARQTEMTAFANDTLLRSVKGMCPCWTRATAFKRRGSIDWVEGARGTWYLHNAAWITKVSRPAPYAGADAGVGWIKRTELSGLAGVQRTVCRYVWGARLVCFPR